MTSTETIVEAVVIACISEVTCVAPERISRDATYTDLGADSLDAVEFVFRVEFVLNLKLPDSLIECKTVGELIDGIARHLEEKP